MGFENKPVTRWKEPSQLLRIRLCIALVIVDIICIAAGFTIAYFVYSNGRSNQAQLIFSSILPLYVGLAFAGRAYGVDVFIDSMKGLRLSVRSYLLAAATVLFVAFSFKSSEIFSRITFMIGSISCLITLPAGRLIFSRLAKRFFGGNPYNMILISENGLFPPVDDASIVLINSTFDPDRHDPEMYDQLATAVKYADRVVVCCSPERRPAWVHALQGANVQAEILAPELAEFGPIGIHRYGGVPTIVVARGPLSLPDRAIKRAFDIAVAGGAVVVLLPIFILVGLAIKIESRGPVLFVQTRIGRANQKFKMLKFRSMHTESSDGHGHSSTSREDRRITRVGRLIRSTSIDELPQLLNVLQGEMSIVGPRPHALGSRAEEKLFWEIDRRYWHRHATKPGLTGLAQVRGFRGATSVEADLVGRLQADLEYLDRWTIWRDVKIVLMTFGVLVHHNAF